VWIRSEYFLLPNAVGYDISKFALKFAKKKGIKTTNNIKEIKNKFDIILCSHVLEHVKDPYKTLKILRSKLKAGGKLILILPVERHGKASFDLDINQHLYCWNFRTINNLLTVANFRVIENSYLYSVTSSKLANLLYSILPITKTSLILYDFLCELVSMILGGKEMKIVAVKSHESS
jgi:SAM-dependent methyltransferase